MSYPGIILGVAAIAATLGLSSLTLNRLIRRKLRLSLFLLAAYVVIRRRARVSAWHPDMRRQT